MQRKEAFKRNVNRQVPLKLREIITSKVSQCSFCQI